MVNTNIYSLKKLLLKQLKKKKIYFNKTALAHNAVSRGIMMAISILFYSDAEVCVPEPPRKLSQDTLDIPTMPQC